MPRRRTAPRAVCHEYARGMSRANALWPLRWDVWDADPDDCVVRIAVSTAGVTAPTYPPEEISVTEDARAVIITVYARRGSTKLGLVTTGIAIPLKAAIGRRRMYDGVDGQRRHRITPATAQGVDARAQVDAMAAAKLWDGPIRGAN